MSGAQNCLRCRASEKLTAARIRWIAGAACLFLTLSPALSQELGPATDYEWELQTPGRTMFRDRSLIGSVPLAQTRERKSPLTKAKVRTHEALAVYTDVSFVPGDTTRYFGADLVLQGEAELFASVILDPDELGPLETALRYILKTAEGIRTSERSDTQIFFRGKNNWEVLFQQQGTAQRIEIHFAAVSSFAEQRRDLQAAQVTALADIVATALSELKRQGALSPEGP